MNKLLLLLASAALVACQNTSQNTVEAGTAPEAPAMGCCAEQSSCDMDAAKSTDCGDCDMGDAKSADCGDCDMAAPMACEGEKN